MQNEPLGLPKGSVRAILALLVVVSAIVGQFIVGSVSSELNTLANVALAFYFGTRSNGSKEA